MTDGKKQVNVAHQPISKWATADGYKLDAFDQIEGAWPIGHPLPLPKWTIKTKDTLNVEKVPSTHIYKNTVCLMFLNVFFFIILYRFGNTKTCVL